MGCEEDENECIKRMAMALAECSGFSKDIFDKNAGFIFDFICGYNELCLNIGRREVFKCLSKAHGDILSMKEKESKDDNV